MNNIFVSFGIGGVFIEQRVAGKEYMQTRQLEKAREARSYKYNRIYL